MGRRRVGPQAIREYLGRMRERYAQAARPAKGRLLDEVCEVTGYHRKAVIRLLRRPERSGRRRRGGPAGPLWSGGRGHVAANLGGRRLPVVSAAAGAAADVVAVGVSAVADPPRGRRAAPEDESAADGSLPAAVQARAAQAAIRPDETGDAPQASDSAEDRPVGCPGAGLHRDRPRGAFRRLRRRRVSAFAERDRHPYDVGGNAGTFVDASTDGRLDGPGQPVQHAGLLSHRVLGSRGRGTRFSQQRLTALRRKPLLCGWTGQVASTGQRAGP